MKITEQDIDLANRFPPKTCFWGYGMSMADAKISPQQLQRLLKLNLICVVDKHKGTGGMCGVDGAKNYGSGFGRNATSFIKVVKS